jgi:hypothetical protein
MSKKAAPEGALFVRLPATAVDKLDRAAEALGIRKKDLVARLVSRYVDPDSRRGLHELSTAAGPKVSFETHEPTTTLGSYTFHPHEPPEVLSAEQAGHFLQLDEALVTRLAEAGKLPGRKLGDVWRFSRAALIAWLATPEKGS